MSRAEITPVASHGRLVAAKEAARAKRILNSTVLIGPSTKGAALSNAAPNLLALRAASEGGPSMSTTITGPVSNGSLGRIARNPRRSSELTPSLELKVASLDVLVPRLRRASTTPVSRTTVVRPGHSRTSHREKIAQNEQIVPARSGDHPEIYQLLLAIFQGPSPEDYYATQDQPDYDPGHRLLFKRDGRLVSHVELSYRSMMFGRRSLPVARLGWLGTLPEFRSHGYATQLLVAAEQQMRNQGAMLGVLRTREPHFFRRAGWAVCGRHSQSTARARDVLAHLAIAPVADRTPLSIRLWRHVELPSLMRIYAQNTAGSFGPLERSEAYWRWLISRKAFDYILVAIFGRDRMELVDTNAPIVGYAAVRQQRVVEMFASPEYPSTAVQMLSRTCGDAIERNRQSVVLEAPPADPLHRLFVESGGVFNHNESESGEVMMVKLLDPAGLIATMADDLVARAKAAELPPACELGLLVDGRKQSLTVSSSGVTLCDGRLGRSYLSLKNTEFTRLLLGHGNIHDAIRQGRVAASTQFAAEMAGVLFPQLPLWRPSWDELPG